MSKYILKQFVFHYIYIYIYIYIYGEGKMVLKYIFLKS